MYEPTTMMAVALAKAKKKQAEANARISEADAAAAENKAAYDETLHRERVRKILSGQRAAIGKSGVTMEGTPLLALEETAKAGELDALAIRYGGDVEASRSRSQAAIERQAGKTAKRASYFQAGSTLLTGGARAYGAYKGL
jgi:hypothetical protein